VVVLAGVLRALRLAGVLLRSGSTTLLAPLGLVLDGIHQADFVKRTGDQISQSREAAIEHSPGAPPDADVSRFENLERDDGGAHKIPQFMDEESDPFVVAVRGFAGVCLLAFGSSRSSTTTAH
jgi:hypothetical protein